MTRRLATLLGLLLLLDPAARAGELPTAKPAEVGLDADELAKIAPALQKLVDDHQIPGALALLVRDGKVAYAEAVGYRDLEKKEPMADDTIFAIASMTKPITCVAVMTLVEQGKLGLDDPVGKYLPELAELRVLGDAEDDRDGAVATVPAERPVTIRDLLSHTSGISYGGALGGALGGDPRQAKEYDRVRVMGPDVGTIAEQVRRLGQVPLAHQPGARWTYGLSHDVLGRVVEVVSGESFDRYLQAHILDPLDMRDTSFLVPESKRDRLATIYRDDAGTLAPLPKNPGSKTMFSGGGGLFSTARDYARFAQMLLNGGELDGARVLKAETIAEMTTNQIGRNTALALFKYGLGFGLEVTPALLGRPAKLNRYFWGGIFSTNFWVDPGHEMVAVVMTQVLPTNHGNAHLVVRRYVDAAIQ
jgi:CubicO group peptidase (beta-lactamase class C family)